MLHLIRILFVVNFFFFVYNGSFLFRGYWDRHALLMALNGGACILLGLSWWIHQQLMRKNIERRMAEIRARRRY